MAHSLMGITSRFYGLADMLAMKVHVTGSDTIAAEGERTITFHGLKVKFPTVILSSMCTRHTAFALVRFTGNLGALMMSGDERNPDKCFVYLLDFAKIEGDLYGVFEARGFKDEAEVIAFIDPAVVRCYAYGTKSHAWKRVG